MSNHFESNPQLMAAFEELRQVQDKILALKRAVQPLNVADYQLKTPEGNEVSLFSLFGGKDELMVIHNMGRGCRYCTLWADGFNGFVSHFENRVPFVIVTPDKSEIVKAFSESRGWKFKILSAHGTSFIGDMGFEKNGKPQPGVSTFLRKPDGSVLRTASDFFGPGDDYCSVWHLFDLLPKGVNGWEPQYKY
jgi:predicted dithiol-disulfide oxidoreductase (DUF899 family)